MLLLLVFPVSGAAYYLTSGDPLSVVFVSIALVAFLMLSAGLLVWERRVAGRIESLGQGPLVLERLKNTAFESMIPAFSTSICADISGKEVRTSSAVPLLMPGAGQLSPTLKPSPLLQSGQALLVSIGLFGTFFGLSYGLLESIPCIDANDSGHAACIARLPAGVAQADQQARAMELGMSILLGGARTAFSKSVAGIGLGLVWLLVFRQREAAWRDRLRSIGMRVDAAYTPVSRDSLLLERLIELQKKQPDLGELGRSGAGIASGAAALGAAAASLKDVGGRLAEAVDRLSPEALGEKLTRGLETAIERQLRPTLVGIDEGLEELKALKTATDTEIKRQLAAMLEGLRKEALAPLAAELTRTQENIARVAGLVTESTAATRATAAAIGGMAGELHKFQGESLSRLEGFSLNLGKNLESFNEKNQAQLEKMAGSIERSVGIASAGMEAQRLAFEASARSASEGFKTLTRALEVTGEQASQVILQAGLDAGGVMHDAKTQLAEGIQSSVAGIETSQKRLEAAGKLATDQAIDQTRARLAELVKTQVEAIEKLEHAARAIAKLPLTNQASEAALKTTTLEATQILARSLLESQKATEQLYTSLQNSLSKNQTEQARFFTEADEHLAAILGGLHKLLDHIATVVQEIRDTRAQQD